MRRHCSGNFTNVGRVYSQPCQVSRFPVSVRCSHDETPSSGQPCHNLYFRDEKLRLMRTSDFLWVTQLSEAELDPDLVFSLWGSAHGFHLPPSLCDYPHLSSLPSTVLQPYQTHHRLLKSLSMVRANYKLGQSCPREGQGLVCTQQDLPETLVFGI